MLMVIIHPAMYCLACSDDEPLEHSLTCARTVCGINVPKVAVSSNSSILSRHIKLVGYNISIILSPFDHMTIVLCVRGEFHTNTRISLFCQFYFSFPFSTNADEL